MPVHILGVNTAYHESSACLLRDGELVATAEEERFSRIRYGKHSRVDNPDELPEQAMAWCLKQGGIGLEGSRGHRLFARPGRAPTAKPELA